MICQNLANLLGIDCHPLDANGTLAMLETPFTFSDGDPIPVFMQARDNTVRFFDDGRVFLHFRGRGLSLETRKQAKPIVQAALRHGASYTDEWILEAWANEKQSALAFSRYMGAMLEICAWEKENEGAVEDADLLIDEAISCFLGENPEAKIERSPRYPSVSGRPRHLSLQVDGLGVAVTGTHHASVSSALLNMVDILQAPDNQGKSFMFLIADQQDPEKASQHAAILQAAAPVQLMSKMKFAARPQKSFH